MKQINFALLWISLLMLLTASSALGQKPTLVSVNRAGTSSGNIFTSYDTNPVITPDGRFVAFESYASDLVLNDKNSDRDIFVRDLVTRKTTLVSISTTGESGNGESYYPIISPDGRFVAFISRADNLVTQTDTNSNTDVFIRDLQERKTILVSVDNSGMSTGDAFSGGILDVTPQIPLSMSSDGKFVAFASHADNLVPNDDNNYTSDVFVRNVIEGTTTLVSINKDGTGSGEGAYMPRISANGRFVAFVGNGNHVVNDNNDKGDVFIRDLQTNTTSLVSVNNAGTNSGNGASSEPVMTPDGRFVAFMSQANNLVANDHNGDATDVFIRDRVTNTTSLISINSSGTSGGDFWGSSFPVMSANGRFVAFASYSSNLVANDINGTGQDVFVRDRQTGVTKLVSINSAGTGSGNNWSWAPSISADGRFVAFKAYATDLVATDKDPNRTDVFLRDLVRGTTSMVSINLTDTYGGNVDSASNSTPMISADGRFITFDSYASDLVENDHNNEVDIFVAPVQAGRMQFSLAAYNVNEGAGSASIIVKRTGGSVGQVKVNYYTSNGSSTAGKDYTAVRGTLSFASGEVSKTLTIPITDDVLDEQNETINLILSNPMGGAGLGAQKTAVLTIIDNDLPPALSINDVTITEGDSGTIRATFNVSMSAVSGNAVTVKFATANGTAMSGSDYLSASGQLTFNPSQTTKTITVAVTGDTLREADETFKVNLSAPTYAKIADGMGIGTIVNND